jgi:hypothetical protein
MIKKIILLLLITFLSKAVFCQSWIYVGKSSDGNPYYMRSTSVESSLTKKVWVKHNKSKLTVKKSGRTLTYINGYDVLLYEFNCEEKQLMLHSVISYSSKGTVVDSYRPQDYEKEWSDVVPESVGEMLLEKACELF